MFIFSLELSRISKDAKKTCDLSYVGFQALKSHEDGKNIRRLWLLFSVFFKKSTKSRSTSSESSQRNASSST